MTARHRRLMPLREHLFWTIVVAVGVVTAGLVVWFVAQADSSPAPAVSAPAPATAPAPCVWDDELVNTLDELGEVPSDWTITDLDRNQWGRVRMDARRAFIDRDTPCEDVSSVVKHEWMHLQQARRYGGNRASYAAYGWSADQLEIVADCGAMILGATYTPYVEARSKGVSSGCSDGDLAAAHALIDYR